LDGKTKLLKNDPGLEFTLRGMLLGAGVTTGIFCVLVCLTTLFLVKNIW
jgi:hypothetical protein